MGNPASGTASTARSIALMTSSCTVWLAGSCSVTEMTRPSPSPGIDSQALAASSTSGIDPSAARISVSSATGSAGGRPTRNWAPSVTATGIGSAARYPTPSG
jgi:hypothetical protein